MAGGELGCWYDFVPTEDITIYDICILLKNMHIKVNDSYYNDLS
jgi:hypothetical protein